jgi:hypothetical protein
MRLVVPRNSGDKSSSIIELHNDLVMQIQTCKHFLNVRSVRHSTQSLVAHVSMRLLKANTSDGFS